MNNANGGNILFHFKGDTSNLKNATNSLGGMTKSILMATGIAKAFSVGMNMITSSTDAAVDRLDQLNAFPRVMSSLGIETSKSQKAIKDLSDGLKGLPTTLNQGTSAVTRFVSVNEDVEYSTKMFLALNDAIIAGNASTEIQAAALEQLTQAYSKGKPDAQDWKTIMQAMPAQLKQVAKSMGYTSTTIGGDFYEALQKGEISMDDFMNKIIELDEKGGEGFESLRKQALSATGGIKTAITNMRTAVARGMAGVIDSIDKGLKTGGVENGINGLITRMGVAFETGLNQLSQELEPIVAGVISGDMGLDTATQTFTNKLLNGLIQGITLINQGIPEIVPRIADITVGLSKSIDDSFPTIVAKATQLIGTLVNELNKEENQQKLANVGANLINAFVKGAVEFFKNNGIQIIYNALRTVSNLPYEIGRRIIIEFAKGIAEKLGLPKEKVEKIGNTIINIMNGIPRKMSEIGANLVQGFVNGITSRFHAVENVANRLANIVSKVVALKNKIHSPSQLMEWQGQMMGEGYIKGIEGMKKQLYDTVLDTFALSPQITDSSSLHYSPNIVVQNNITAKTDPLGQTVTNIKTFSNGAKNDYNYGMGG